jgi:three-Cys-motif partner protein
MPQRDPERYTQGDDGLIVEKVGSWAIEKKLKVLTDYVYASGGARKRYLAKGAAYIDPFCGPGRSLVRETTDFIDGSPVAAFKRALDSPGPFTSINISDGDEELLTAATKRLNALNAPVRPVEGPASEAMPKIVRSLDQYGLHLAFLDPYNLGALSFDLFQELASDMITALGGAVAVPSAVRRSESTTTMRVNEVIISRIEGASDNTVSSAISWITRSVRPAPWPK